VTIPSYEVRVGDVLTLGPKAREIPDVQESLKSGNPVPAWLQRRDTEGVVSGVPTAQDFEVHIEPQRIVEYYSR
jgi:ribosomal protein S4